MWSDPKEILGDFEIGFRGRPEHGKRFLVYISKCCFPISTVFPKKTLFYILKCRSRVVRQDEDIALARAEIMPIYFSSFSKRCGQLFFETLKPLKTMELRQSKLNDQLEVHLYINQQTFSLTLVPSGNAVICDAIEARILIAVAHSIKATLDKANAPPKTNGILGTRR